MADNILNTLGPIGKRKIMDQMSEIKPNPGEKVACQFRIVSEVRNMIQQGYIKLEKVDPNLAIDENIEDKLASTPFNITAEMQKTPDSSSSHSSTNARSSSSSGSGGLDFSGADRGAGEPARCAGACRR